MKMFGVGLPTIWVGFKLVAFFFLVLFLVWLVVNGIIWAVRFFIDNMGESFKGHGDWFKSLVKILLPSLKNRRKKK